MGTFAVEKSDDEWRKALNPMEFRVLRKGGTEPPGSSEYDKAMPTSGHYKCAGCGYPLYTAKSKFKSSCGWPCFDQVVYTDAGGSHVGLRGHNPGDNYFEIICNNCGGHLGHVFYGEGCTPKNERHCANGISLKYDQADLKDFKEDKVDKGTLNKK